MKNVNSTQEIQVENEFISTIDVLSGWFDRLFRLSCGLNRMCTGCICVMLGFSSDFIHSWFFVSLCCALFIFCFFSKYISISYALRCKLKFNGWRLCMCILKIYWKTTKHTIWLDTYAYICECEYVYHFIIHMVLWNCWNIHLALWSQLKAPCTFYFDHLSEIRTIVKSTKQIRRRWANE